MTHSMESKNKFIEMRAEGCTFAKIAEELNISYNTAVNWSREFSDNISAAKAFKNEELIEKFRMTKEKS
jgi:orotate phosphoribosyltransferase-like protein